MKISEDTYGAFTRLVQGIMDNMAEPAAIEDLKVIGKGIGLTEKDLKEEFNELYNDDETENDDEPNEDE